MALAVISVANERSSRALLDQSAGCRFRAPRVADDGHVTAGFQEPHQPAPGDRSCMA